MRSIEAEQLHNQSQDLYKLIIRGAILKSGGIENLSKMCGIASSSIYGVLNGNRKFNALKRVALIVEKTTKE